MIKPEEIARKYERIHSGYKLIGYAEVGLPVTELNLEVYTIAYKKLSPIFEFTLKSINADLTEIGELSSFLGFSEKFMEGVLSELISSDDVALIGDKSDRRQRLKLTGKGLKNLESAERSEIKEQVIPINFDVILNKPVFLRDEFLYSPKELRDNGWLDIPTLTTKRIELTDININELQVFIEQLGRWTNENRRIVILSIKNILKRFSKYRYAVALRYKSDNGSERISFALDGILSEEFENNFAQKDGIAKLRLDRFHSEEPELLEEIKSFTLDPQTNEQIIALKDEENTASLAISKAKEKIISSPDAEIKVEAEKELKTAEIKLAVIQNELTQFPVRPVSVFEHPPLLDEALTNSNERLMIIAPWIRTKVVDFNFINKLEKLLQKGTKVYIGYGIGDGKNDPGAIRKLERLYEKYTNFTFKEFGNTHAKVLLSDSEFVVVGSFNWLSFKGDPNAIFRDEQSFLVSIPQVIEDKFKEQLLRFN